MNEPLSDAEMRECGALLDYMREELKRSQAQLVGVPRRVRRAFTWGMFAGSVAALVVAHVCA